jgi:hypothetical protein
MPLEFSATCDVSHQLYEQVSASAPDNPFYTSKYCAARRQLGSQPWILALRQNDRVVSACTGFMKAALLRRSLEIPSVPELREAGVFWRGLLKFCKDNGVIALSVNSAASPSANIPSLPGEIHRRTRYEFLFNLQQTTLGSTLSANHWRNIKRSQRAGVKIERASDPQACEQHICLMRASMKRRTMRGEIVPEHLEIRNYLAYTETGAGEIFRAVLDGKVLSSILVLMSDRTGYYQSAGTTPEGMESGASHFLIHEIANLLREESKEMFNLGGAEMSNPGLIRFKAGFGTRQVQLESATFFLGGNMRRMVISAAHNLRVQLDAFRPDLKIAQ